MMLFALYACLLLPCGPLRPQAPAAPAAPDAPAAISYLAE